jgi:cytochrome c-type biogenesis protein
MLADLSIYLGVALAGFVSFLSPCVLPLVPPYLGYLGGMTVEQISGDERLDSRAWSRVILASLCFVAGFTTVFVGLGAGASAFGQLIQTYKATLAIVAGSVITLFGLHFLGIVRVPLLYREARYRSETESASLAGAFVMGLAFAFGWTPCIGPILATVLAVAANEGTLATGVKMLAVYSLGLGVPFVLAAVAIRPFMGFMHRFRRHLGRVEKVMGVVLVVTGLLFAGEPLALVRESLVGAVPALGSLSTWLGLLLAAIGIALMLMLPDAWIRRTGLATLVVGMMLIGGSINFLGQWLIEHVPVLGQIEELATSPSLQTEILRQGSGK